MTIEQDDMLREQLRNALKGEQSHITFESAITDFPVAEAGLKPAGAPHSAWQLLEHLRIAQSDILEFSRNPQHQSPKWPEGYWPMEDAPKDEDGWNTSVKAYLEDAEAMSKMVTDPAQDLYQPIEGGNGQTLLREAMVLATHNSYHLGQLMFVKRMLDQG